MSLRQRVVLAVALTIGFYALALGLIAGMVWVILQPNVPGRLWAFCLGAIAVIAISIIPWPRRFVPPGPLLNPAGQPRLFAELQNVARAVGEAMPAEVYISPEMNAGVLQRGRRRVMVLGLPLMQVLTVNEMRAVLAHEFGHYHGGDTRLGPFIYRTREAIERILRNASRQSAILQLPFLFYGRMFLRVTQAISRRQELTADALAARTFGAQAMIEGLRALARGAVAWSAYWRSEVVPLLDAGFQPPITEGFQRFINEPEIWRKAHSAAQQMLAESRGDPYDSHPPDSERIAALAAMPAGPGDGTGPAAASLVDGIDAIEPFLLMGLLQPGVQMRRIRWQDAGTVALLPGLTDRVRRQAHLLRGYTAGWMPELVGYAERLGQSEAGAAAAQLTPEQARSLGIGLAGAALTVALAGQGWMAESLPGRPIVMRRDDTTVEPFVEADRLARGETPAEVWRQRCSDLGIRDLNLAPA
ncbi:MAG TPA: M48 family metallopeptidase [Candidatus Limnocylindrales bacterium]|nr:M48 family metallopeptidase [Candidatus Limnocylindrales bacterium]